MEELKDLREFPTHENTGGFLLILPGIISDPEELVCRDVATCIRRVIKHLNVPSLTSCNSNTVLMIVS